MSEEKPHWNSVPYEKKLQPITGWISRQEYADLMRGAVLAKVSASSWLRGAVQARLRQEQEKAASTEDADGQAAEGEQKEG